jgi:hypothetical protein
LTAPYLQFSRLGAVTAICLLSMGQGATAATYCDYAIDSYNTAVADIDNRLRSYSRCVSNSLGEDECSTAFRSLRTAHDYFESAVNDIRQECED